MVLPFGEHLSRSMATSSWCELSTNCFGWMLRVWSAAVGTFSSSSFSEEALELLTVTDVSFRLWLSCFLCLKRPGHCNAMLTSAIKCPDIGKGSSQLGKEKNKAWLIESFWSLKTQLLQGFFTLNSRIIYAKRCLIIHD